MTWLVRFGREDFARNKSFERPLICNLVLQIAEQALSSMLGMACGTYVANDEPLHVQRNDSMAGAKRPRILEDTQLPVPGKQPAY